ncbi:permease prefix domain 1-containing protein [Evansella halocellulosilytica]|uniref:permease prefix domain 1-containing protein n=1 Tax=Evansella halocellulosilytica TaxID=2011013 RepID=UPI000BB7697C|nr:permease prefix domain 1-containing protein [Evansella halocellulosilytica]
MSAISQYIDSILIHIEANKKEYDGLKAELTAYIEEKKLYYIQKGYPESKAAEKAISDFGSYDEVGQALSKSIFPQRRYALSSLLIISIIYTVFVSIMVYIEHSIIPVFLLLIVTFLSLTNLWLTKRQLLIARYRLAFIGFGFIYVITWFYGSFYIDGVSSGILTWLLMAIALIYLLTIVVNIVLGAIYQPISRYFMKAPVKNRVLIIISNSISGIIVLSYLLSTLFGFLIFGSPDIRYTLYILIPSVLTTSIWIISIIISSRFHKLAWVSTILQFLICAYVIYYWFLAFSV